MVKLSTERFLPGLSRVKISKQYAEYKLSKQGFSISSLWRDVGEADGRCPPSKELPPSDRLCWSIDGHWCTDRYLQENFMDDI